MEGGIGGGSELGKEERKRHTTSACREKIKKWVIKLIYNAIGSGNNVNVILRTRTAKKNKMSNECSLTEWEKRKQKENQSNGKRKRKHLKIIYWIFIYIIYKC